MNSSVSIVTTLRDGQRRNRNLILGSATDFYLFRNVQAGSGTQPVYYIMHMRTLNLHLEPRLGIRGAVSPLPHISSCVMFKCANG